MHVGRGMCEMKGWYGLVDSKYVACRKPRAQTRVALIGHFYSWLLWRESRMSEVQGYPAKPSKNYTLFRAEYSSASTLFSLYYFYIWLCLSVGAHALILGHILAKASLGSQRETWAVELSSIASDICTHIFFFNWRNQLISPFKNFLEQG